MHVVFSDSGTPSTVTPPWEEERTDTDMATVSDLKLKIDEVHSTAVVMKSIVDFLHTGLHADGNTILYIKDQLVEIRSHLKNNYEFAFIDAAIKYLEDASSNKYVPLATAAKKPGTVKNTWYHTEKMYISNQFPETGTSGKIYAPTIHRAFSNNGHCTINAHGQIIERGKGWNNQLEKHFFGREAPVGKPFEAIPADHRGFRVGMWIPLSKWMTRDSWKGGYKEEDGVNWGRIYFPYGILSLRKHAGSYQLFPLGATTGESTACTCDALGMCENFPLLDEKGNEIKDDHKIITAYLAPSAKELWKGKTVPTTLAGVSYDLVDIYPRVITEPAISDTKLPPKKKEKATVA